MSYVIEFGNSNNTVMSFQKMLNVWLSHWKKSVLTPDGDYGPKTMAAVNDFQKNNKITIEKGVTERCWDLVEGFYTKMESDKEIPVENTIKTYKRGSGETLSGFPIRTFDCKCGGAYCSSTKVSTKSLDLLRKLVRHFEAIGKRTTVTSAYRCPVHNRNVGGVSNSRHTVGDAIDVVVDGTSPSEIARVAEDLGFDGVGIYASGFVHMDTRGYKSRW